MAPPRGYSCLQRGSGSGGLLALALPLGIATPLAQQSLASVRHVQRVAAPHPGDPIQQPRAAQPPPVDLTPPAAAPRHDPPANLTPPPAAGDGTASTPAAYPTANPQDAARLFAAQQATPKPALTPAHYPTAIAQDTTRLAAAQQATLHPALTPAHYPTADPQDAALLAAQKSATPAH